MKLVKDTPGAGKVVLTIALILLLILAIGVGILVVRFRKFYDEYSEEMTQSLNTIVGKESPDFSVPLTDGTTVTLSDLLKDHDVVVPTKIRLRQAA